MDWWAKKQRGNTYFRYSKRLVLNCGTGMCVCFFFNRCIWKPVLQNLFPVPTRTVAWHWRGKILNNTWLHVQVEDHWVWSLQRATPRMSHAGRSNILILINTEISWTHVVIMGQFSSLECRLFYGMINNGYRTEWRPHRPAIMRVVKNTQTTA